MCTGNVLSLPLGGPSGGLSSTSLSWHKFTDILAANIVFLLFLSTSLLVQVCFRFHLTSTEVSFDDGSLSSSWFNKFSGFGMCEFIVFAAFRGLFGYFLKLIN